MRFIFELNHPKHYYQFKYIMSILEERGHSIMVLARDKDFLLRVLQEEKVPYNVFGVHKESISGKVFSSFSILKHYKQIAKEFSPDVIVSKASLYGTLVAKMLGCKSFIFPDSEVVKLTNRVVAPLATRIITPEPFTIDFGEKHIRIKGVFEDCYLAPGVLSIDKSYPEKHSLQCPYAILRFVGWTANHDLNNNGFSLDEKIALVDSISKYMTNADLYVGDSQTMATEAALLGTPAIRSNSFVGENDMSNFKMLEKDYDLLLNIKDFKTVLNVATDFAKVSRKVEWERKRDDYYRSVGNTNKYIAGLLEECSSTP